MLLTNNSPKTEQPNGTKILLKPHQLAMLKRCQTIEESDYTHGILSDKPGSGKTFVILSLILCDTIKEPNVHSNIIVVPLNIYNQWLDAIHSFTDKLSVKTYTSYEDITDLYYTHDLEQSDIILTTTLYYNLVSDTLNAAGINVKRVFIDEVDSVDNMLTKKINGDIVWMVSASYSYERTKNLNKTFDSKVLDLGKPKSEHNFTCQCEEEFVNKSFGVPSPVTHNYICRSSFLDLMLKDVLDDKELHAAHASDFSLIKRYTYQSVAKDDKEAVIFLLKDMNMTIESEEVKLQDYLQKKNKLSMTEKLNKQECIDLIKICSDKLNLLVSKIQGLHLCIGCMEQLDEGEEQYQSSCCNKRMCKKCIDKWYSHTLYCSYCRKKPDRDSHDIILPSKTNDDVKLMSTEYTQHDKMETLFDLLTCKTGNKVILFSDYSKIFTQVRNSLKYYKIPHVELDAGNISEMNKVIDEYKNGSARILLSNSSFYGCGMNLENTDDIIFYHTTNKEMYKQVIGRAQRPGRKSTLQIHNLLYVSE